MRKFALYHKGIVPTPTYIRYTLVMAFVAVYIAVGFLLRLGVVSYLLLGIPLTTAFQLLVARKPLHQLWMRHEQRFFMSNRSWAITLCLLILPLYNIVTLTITHKLSVPVFSYYCAVALGAFPAGYSFGLLTKKTAKDLLACLFITCLARTSLYFVPLLMGKSGYYPTYTRSLAALLTYIPIAFVVEEVVFRGLLDTYTQPHEGRFHVGSAIFVSLLWGVWHLPLYAGTGLNIRSLAGPLVISLWGIFLSLFWRRSGNLAVPVFSHAFADAIRDAFK